ncbi:MAG: alpha-amylase family glycosyl hydrolase [Rubrobacteraceae bacterium]
MSEASKKHLWWQKGVVYQIYPRSFMDSNADGIGDLPGITTKLEYVAHLGVDAVWLSPIFSSPMADFGYDVSDYTGIHPMFGTLEDFDAFVEKAHGLGLKVILDYVPNHTSDEHPWFVESRSSKVNPKRDWYVWRDAKPDGSVPNNWLSEFGGPAWSWDEKTGQYYYRAYHEKQPDLNWRNPEVREAMVDVLRFWMDRGVDGFRVDAVNHLAEDESFRDDPPNPDWDGKDSRHVYHRQIPIHTSNLPETHEAVADMRRTLDSHGGAERLLIGEVYLSGEELMAYYGVANDGFHMPTNMELVRAAWDARKISAYIEAYEAALPEGAWPNWVVGNHDNPRIASRVGKGQARVAAMLLLTLRGTPTIYYGDEIGMTDGDVPPELERDPVAKSVPGFGRDPERTPMQWNATEKNAGFSDSEPWLPVPEGDFATVEAQRGDSYSMLALHRKLLALRRAEDALSVGSYSPSEVRDDLLSYIRGHDGRRLLVALNFGEKDVDLDVPFRGRISLSTHLDREGEEVSDSVSLRPNEGVVVEES